MRIASTLYRGTMATLGLVLLMSGATTLSGQTPENPQLILHNTLMFAHQINATSLPQPQTLRVYSNPASVGFTATVSTTTGAGWLAVNGLLSYPGNTGTAGQNDLTVSVAPNLSAGTYNGTITVTSGGTVVPISVTLNVTAAPVIRVDPASLVDSPVEAGRSTTLNLNIGSSGAQTQYTTQVTTFPDTGWLGVLPNLGATGTTAQLVINAANIPANTTLATAMVRFSGIGGTVTMPISVIVTPGASLQVSPTTVNFPYQIGFTAPTARSVNITSSTQTQLTYTASVITSSPWLTLSTTQNGTGSSMISGTTPGPIWLIPNVATVPQTPGTLEATVRIQSTTGVTQDVTARLQISSQPQLTLSQDSAAFVYTLGSTVPSPQTVTVGTTSFPQTLTITPTYTTGGTWFTISPPLGTTPQPITISVDPTRLAQLAAGTYTGSVGVVSSTSNVTIPVSLTVSGSALITVQPSTIEPFTWSPGQPTPPERTLTVSSTNGTNQAFTLNVEYGTGATGWLLLSPPTSGSTGTTGTLLQLNVNTTAVTTAGTYTATLVIQPTSVAAAAPVRIPITYIVGGSTSVTATPTSITATQNGTTPPAAQTITLATQTPGLSFIAQGNPSWIRVTPTSGSISTVTTSPTTLQVSFDTATLAPGDYTGNVTVSVGGASTLTIPVTLRVQGASTITVAPTTLAFTAAQGGSAPAAQTLNLTATGPSVNFTATATTTTPNTNWLRVEPASGTVSSTTPATVTARVDPTGLTAGSYTGSIAIASTGAAPVTVNVTLTVSTVAQPQIRAVLNAASGLARGVSPGLLATVFGTNLAPTTGTNGTIVNNAYTSSLAEVQVFFDDIAAPLLYVGPGGGQSQINLVVPYGIGGRTSTSVVVSYRGVRSSPVTYQVSESAPGIFTPSGGTGNGSILNQNNSVNSTTTPARRGEVIQIFATGEGTVVPSVAAGTIIQPVASDLRRPVLPVTVRLGDQTLSADYAGSAPNLVTGAFQVNVRIPENFPVTGLQNVPLTVQVGSAVSQPGVTVAVTQ